MLLVILSCKKQKGILDDFDSGRLILFALGMKMEHRIQ